MLEEGYEAHIFWNAPENHTAVDTGSFVALIRKLAADCHGRHLVVDRTFPADEMENIFHRLEKMENHGLRISIGCRLDGRGAFDWVRGKKKSNTVVQIQWHQGGRPLPDLGYFKAFSGAGVWNHLVLDDETHGKKALQAAVTQPNILHSWETTRPVGHEEIRNMAYTQVRPLPGRPLWQIASDPVQRFLLVDQLNKDRLLRMRVDEDGEHLYTVGTDLRYHFEPPHQLPAGYLDEICNMVAAGGTVATTHVRANLERAHLIGYVMEKGVIVANSSLKNPRSQYIDRVRQQSGLDLTDYLERGYTSVRPEYRGLGLGTGLLAGLTERAKDRKIFSVIAEDNEATKIIARRNRTRQVATYFSEKAGKPVGIWMPEWMIDP